MPDGCHRAAGQHADGPTFGGGRAVRRLRRVAVVADGQRTGTALRGDGRERAERRGRQQPDATRLGMPDK